jgi:hypothetical protein
MLTRLQANEAAWRSNYSTLERQHARTAARSNDSNSPTLLFDQSFSTGA